jgi:hypothetical protein
LLPVPFLGIVAPRFTSSHGGRNYQSDRIASSIVQGWLHSYRIEVPQSGSRALLSRYNKESRAHLIEGFGYLARLSDADYTEMVNEFIQSISPSGRGGPTLGPRFGMDQRQVNALAGAASFVLFAVGFGAETAEQVLEYAIGALELDAAIKPSLSKFGRVVEENSANLKRAFELTRLSNEVLPSLLQFETALDLRLGFDNETIASVIPVVVVHVDTDSEQEIWFQLSKGQLERLSDDLKKVLDQIVRAEEWAKAR